MATKPEPFTWGDQVAYAAESLLDAAKGALTDGGRPVPSTIYATEGTPVHDCEQLTITLLQVYFGPPGEQAETPNPCDGMITGVFQLELVRCMSPSYNAKTRSGGTPEEKHTSSMELYKDAAVLMRTPTYMPSPDFDRDVMGDLTIGEPSGGYIAITMNIVVGLAA